MPSYQDYVVARDDHDSNTGGSGSHGAASSADTALKRGQSRVVRTRTFLVGNLDREAMNKPSPASGSEVGEDEEADED